GIGLSVSSNTIDNLGLGGFAGIDIGNVEAYFLKTDLNVISGVTDEGILINLFNGLGPNATPRTAIHAEKLSTRDEVRERMKEIIVRHRQPAGALVASEGGKQKSGSVATRRF